ncbi:hypothetical protein [Winogradskyella sp.]|uniref:hypothetical protein n=1 Tax=Winogradskyella sp. TaxID=1883156 RepID=UPI003BAC5BCF
MKKVLFFTILIISNYSYSQISTRHFIKGVEIVDYITFELCADSISGINQVELVKEKTNHKIQANIDLMIDFLKNFDYPKDGPLVGRCGVLTFSLINPEFENIELTDSEKKQCLKFRKGKYEYHHINHKSTKVKRGRRIQKEKSYRGNQIYKIVWTSDSTYDLIYHRLTNDKLKYLIGEKIKVEIIKLIGDNGYVYRSTSPNGVVYYGALYKSKN